MIAVGSDHGGLELKDAILATIQRYRVRWLLGVPALYRMILENDRLDRYDLGSLTYCYCGGDVLPEEVKELGSYVMTLNLHKEVQPELRFEVVAE